MTRLGLRSALLLIFVAAGCGDGGHDYPDEVVTSFVTSCQQQADAGHCNCAIDKLQEAYSYDEFQSLEKRLNEPEVQKQMADTVSDCR